MSTILSPDACVFVFGSNRRGIHGAGAAKYAARHRGARSGVGEGFFESPNGGSYALPTKATPYEKAAWADIEAAAARFLDFAAGRPGLSFLLTRLGCGLAGYSDEDMAALFRDAPENCWLPGRWRRALRVADAALVIAASEEAPPPGFMEEKLRKIEGRLHDRGVRLSRLVCWADTPAERDALHWADRKSIDTLRLNAGNGAHWAAWAGTHAALFNAHGADLGREQTQLHEVLVRERLPLAVLRYERAAPVSRPRREPGN